MMPNAMTSLCTFLSVAFSLVLSGIAGGQQTSVKLWPQTPPGQNAAQGAEADTTASNGNLVAGKSVIRLGNVSEPMLTIFSPKDENNTGAAVMVCPGGGYNILAYDLEGTEVCEWLNTLGVTGVLLKYRVPRPNKGELPVEPLQDAQRGLSLIRNRAADWKIDPTRIGVLGFSAGGNLAARLSTNYEQRAYSKIDAIDETKCRPDFAVLVYPAYLSENGSDALLTAGLTVDKQTPPMFLTMAFDDRIGPENILRMGLALKAAEVPAEVHLYPTGGHGYGLRRTEHAATSWPDRCAEWMNAMGWLEQ